MSIVVLTKNKGLLSALVAVAVAILVIVAILLPKQEKGAQASASEPTQAATEAACPGFELKLDPNKNGRVVSTSIRGNAKESVEKMLEAAKHDWRPLQSYWNDSPLGRKNSLGATSAAKLFVNGCMTAGGQAMWYQLAGAMRSARAEIITVPKNKPIGNTYASSSGLTVKNEKLTGDTTATKLTFRDGSTSTVLHRCGNVVGKFESLSHVNKGFQDEEGHNVKPPPDADPTPPDDVMPQPTAEGTPSPKPSSTPSPSPTQSADPNPCGPGGCASPSPSLSPTPTATATPTEPPPCDPSDDSCG